MLKKILTFSVLVPLFIWLVLYASNEIFLSFTSIIVIIAAFEWLKLLTANNNLGKSYALISLLLFFSLIILLLITRSYWFVIINEIMVAANIFWVIVFFNILLNSKFNWIKNLQFNQSYSCLSCIFALIPSWLAINYMHVYNKFLLLLGCLIIIATDTGGYIFGKFFGKFFGKHKLTIISPNKTWEGVLGGYLGTIFVALVYILILFKFNINKMVIFDFNWKIILKIILITNITFMFSIVGDLFESLVKRTYGVKDSGNILPGHGGFLDRIDSFCSGMPIFLMGVLLYKL